MATDLSCLLTAGTTGVCFCGFLFIAQAARSWSVSRPDQRSSKHPSPRNAAVGASTAGQTQTQQPLPATERFRFQLPAAIGLSRDLLCQFMTRTAGEVT